MSHRIPSDYALGSDLSAAERRVLEERAKIRAALRKEYVMKVEDPNRPSGPLHDPAMYRWQAARATYYQYYKMTPKAVGYWIGLVFIPSSLFIWAGVKDMMTFEENCRSGKIPYEKRRNRSIW